MITGCAADYNPRHSKRRYTIIPVYKRFAGKPVKRGDKNYDKATWYYRFKIAGRLYHQSIPEAQTAKDAANAETAVRQKLFNNRYNPAADTTTFKEFVVKTFTPYAERKNPSFATIKIFLDRAVKHFGKSYLRDITPNDCRNYQYKLSRRKKEDGERVKNSTVNREMSTLSHLFNLAIQEDLLDRNPCRFVEKLKEDKGRDRLLSEDERERFWAEVRKDALLSRIVELAVNTGIREGQILAIRKSDIDFEKRRLTIIASKGRDERIVPLNQKAFDVLTEAAAGRTDYLFVSQRTREKLGRFERKWKKCLEDASIDDFRFHDLRHEFASRLMRQNVPQVVIRDLLGHSDVKITAIYTNTDLELLESAVKMLDESMVTETLQ